jgi:hypothetical protein
MPFGTSSPFYAGDLGAASWAGRGIGLGAVVNPNDPDDQVFTERGAWEFVAELLEAGHPLKEVDLKKPVGKKGYELLASGGKGRPEIYMKLQLGSGRVIGRSFHYSKQD